MGHALNSSFKSEPIHLAQTMSSNKTKIAVGGAEYIYASGVCWGGELRALFRRRNAT